MRRRGFRAGVVSLNRDKAGELARQMEAIAGASRLRGLKFFAHPRLTIKSAWGEVSILPADRASGAASGFDLSICDEIGLLQERDRELLAGMRSAVSAKGGKFLSLSVRGSGPFVPEILARDGSPGLKIHSYESPPNCDLDDEDAWLASNPGLGTIKSFSHMRSEARRVAVTTSDEASFRAFELNQVVEPGREMVVSLADWQRCIFKTTPPRSGACFVGLDLGGSSSMTACAIAWGNGRLEVYGAFPGTPSLAERGRVDGQNYALMEKRGELRTYPGRVTPVSDFLNDIAQNIRGERVLACGSDRYRRAEMIQAMDEAGQSGLGWPMVWRGMGASSKADGSADVRAFQSWCLTGKLKMENNLMLAAALKEAVLRRDGSGNPALDRRRNGRIDALSSAVIAIGLAAERSRAKPTWKYHGLV